MNLPRLTLVQWTICAMAAIGFAFDIYVVLILPLIGPPAIRELAPFKPTDPQFAAFANQWRGLLFWIPAMAGGFFGMIGGYLTDLFGRRRILVWSILLYAVATLASGFVTSLTQLLVLRSFAFIGVCVEFVAAVAWLAELFPEPERREAALGYTQAFSSIGGLLVTGTYSICVAWAQDLPAIMGGHEAWRYTLVSGVLPAIPLMIIRPFLPESPVWAKKREEGTLQRPSIGAIFAPEFRRTTIVTTIMFACSFGAAFGAIQQLPSIVPGLAEVAPLPRPQQQLAVSAVQAFQEVGGLLGRFVLAYLAIIIISRRLLLRTFQIPGLIIFPVVFGYLATNNLELLKWGAAAAGFVTVAQLSFWGNYLPTVYPVHLRGTGESFAANIGGRMFGTSAAMVTSQLANVMPGAGPAAKLALAATIVGTALYVIGFGMSFLLPEPGRKQID